MNDWLIVAGLHALIWMLRVLGPVRASNLGGAVARTLGPWLPVSKVARHNLACALPALDAKARARLVRRAWDNLGRTAAELPNLDRIARSPAGPGYELVVAPGAEDFTAGRSAIYFTAHLANWEVLLAVSRDMRQDFGLFYRAAASTAVDAMIRALRVRAAGAQLRQFPKGARGGRQGLVFLRAGGAIGLLADQKANDGIAIPFFGRMAMTSPSGAALALKYGFRLMPTRVERLGPAHWRVTIESPLGLPTGGATGENIRLVTTLMNERIEAWIRARPQDWLWMHRRWPKEPG